VVLKQLGAVGTALGQAHEVPKHHYKAQPWVAHQVLSKEGSEGDGEGKSREDAELRQH